MGNKAVIVWIDVYDEGSYPIHRLRKVLPTIGSADAEAARVAGELLKQGFHFEPARKEHPPE
jgi:hypothetical protein